MTTDLNGLMMYRLAMMMPPDVVWDYLTSLGLKPPEDLQQGESANTEQRHQAANLVVTHFIDESTARAAEETFKEEEAGLAS